jgi:hypothetical protein
LLLRKVIKSNPKEIFIPMAASLLAEVSSPISWSKAIVEDLRAGKDIVLERALEYLAQSKVPE